MKYYVGIDLGGTNIVSGVVDEAFNILATAKIKTKAPRDGEEIAKDMAKTVFDAVASAKLSMDDMEYIGIGSPGVVDSENGNIVFSGNLEFYDVPLRQYIEDFTRKKTYIDNDANCATLGEYLAGAGKDKSLESILAVTLGTGVGGGFVLNGKIYSGFNYAAPEMGHMAVVKDGWQCTCGRKGCFEAYSSATGLIRMTKEKMQENKNSALWTLAKGSLDNVSGRTAFDGMRQKDRDSIEVVDKYMDFLACGITNLINIFQPKVLCIGGGISKEKEYLCTPLEKLVRKEEFSRFCKEKTEILTAKLGNDAGIIGAAMLGNQPA